MGIGQEVYSNPTMFFEKTYVTAGLRDIANRVIRALNGEESENRVVSLQTGFGGGKTHTLISLFHIANAGRSLLNSAYTANLLQEGVVPNFDNAKVAVFTNNTTDVVQGRTTNEVSPSIPYGENSPISWEEWKDIIRYVPMMKAGRLRHLPFSNLS